MKKYQSDKILDALKDALSFSVVEPSMTLEQRKERTTSAVNSAFASMDRTTSAYIVDSTVSALMREYATVRFDSMSAFVKALEKQCTSARFFRSCKDRTIFSFFGNYVTWFNDPDSDDILTVQVSRYIP